MAAQVLLSKMDAGISLNCICGLLVVQGACSPLLSQDCEERLTLLESNVSVGMFLKPFIVGNLKISFFLMLALNI